MPGPASETSPPAAAADQQAAPSTATRLPARARTYRARAAAQVMTLSKSLSRSGRFYDALRFLILAICVVLCLKVMLLLPNYSHHKRLESRRQQTQQLIVDRTSNASSPSATSATAHADADPGNSRRSASDNGGVEMLLGEALVKEVRAAEFASALSAWSEGPMPESVIHSAAECTVRDATDGILRVYLQQEQHQKSQQQESRTTSSRRAGVIDIGANEGNPVTRLALAYGADWVLAVEPDVRNFRRLTRLRAGHPSAGSNNPTATKTSTHNARTHFVAVLGAASDRRGRITMRMHTDRNDFTCVSCLDTRRAEVYTRDVDAWTVDGLVLTRTGRSQGIKPREANRADTDIEAETGAEIDDYSEETLAAAHTYRDYPYGMRDGFGIRDDAAPKDDSETNVGVDITKNTKAGTNRANYMDDDDHVLLFKSDTQGHELQVLSGMTRLLGHRGKVVRNVIVEFDPKLLKTAQTARVVLVTLLDAGLQCAHLRFAGGKKKKDSEKAAVDKTLRANGSELRADAGDNKDRAVADVQGGGTHGHSDGDSSGDNSSMSDLQLPEFGKEIVRGNVDAFVTFVNDSGGRYTDVFCTRRGASAGSNGDESDSLSAQTSQ